MDATSPVVLIVGSGRGNLSFPLTYTPRIIHPYLQLMRLDKVRIHHLLGGLGLLTALFPLSTSQPVGILFIFWPFGVHKPVAHAIIFV
jgi:hypothetical protein